MDLYSTQDVTGDPNQSTQIGYINWTVLTIVGLTFHNTGYTRSTSSEGLIYDCVSGGCYITEDGTIQLTIMGNRSDGFGSSMFGTFILNSKK